MTKWQKTGLILLIISTLAYVKLAFFTESKPTISSEEPKTEDITPQTEQEKSIEPKSYVTIYFIGLNDNKEEVYKVVKRKYNSKKDGSKLNYSINNLFKGPNAKERAKGIYSEVPKDTKLISIDEKPDKVIINVSEDFEQGGGTDSLYKRLYQLIKTANKNSTLNIYLYINGKQAEVIGGEGIMIDQPLSNKSLEE